MALSNIYDQHLQSLMQDLSISEIQNHNLVEKIQEDHSSYAQLKLIEKQMNMLKLEAKNIIETSLFNKNLHHIKCGCKKYPGNYYYLYLDQDYYFSIIAPDQWEFNGQFMGKYYYDFDHSFSLVN
jgi:hypothetical protein